VHNSFNSMPPVAAASTRDLVVRWDGGISVARGLSSSIEGNGVAGAVGGEDGSVERDDGGGERTKNTRRAGSRFNEVTKIHSNLTNLRQNPKTDELCTRINRCDELSQN
jgi:hypothetical protein